MGVGTPLATQKMVSSLPPLVRWEYDYHPEPGSPEAQLTEYYLRDRDWLAEAKSGKSTL